MKIRSAGVTDRGKARQNNEDAFIADDALGIYAVADGVGGLEAGEVASRMVIDALRDAIARLRSGRDDTPPFGIAGAGQKELTALRLAVSLVNRRLREAAERKPVLAAMGTTITAVAVGNDNALCLAHVGDSRAYRLRGRVFEQLTNDHSLTAEQVRAGKIRPDEARRSPYQHVITRAVGIAPEVDVDTAIVPVRPGDRLLLCTDGLTDMLTDDEIAPILRSGGPDQAALALVGKANEKGGKDNITAVVVDWEESAGGRRSS